MQSRAEWLASVQGALESLRPSREPDEAAFPMPMRFIDAAPEIHFEMGPEHPATPNLLFVADERKEDHFEMDAVRPASSDLACQMVESQTSKWIYGPSYHSGFNISTSYFLELANTLVQLLSRANTSSIYSRSYIQSYGLSTFKTSNEINELARKIELNFGHSEQATDYSPSR